MEGPARPTSFSRGENLSIFRHAPSQMPGGSTTKAELGHWLRWKCRALAQAGTRQHDKIALRSSCTELYFNVLQELHPSNVATGPYYNAVTQFVSLYQLYIRVFRPVISVVGITGCRARTVIQLRRVNQNAGTLMVTPRHRRLSKNGVVSFDESIQTGKPVDANVLDARLLRRDSKTRRSNAKTSTRRRQILAIIPNQYSPIRITTSNGYPKHGHSACINTAHVLR